MSFSNIAVIV